MHRCIGCQSTLRISSVLATSMLACVGCDQERAENAGGEWQAQVDTIGDTIVVRTLAGSEWAMAELVPELRIGALDGAEHEIFGDVIGLAVDAESNVYIYDGQVPALRKYGREGEYLGTFGRQGGGPGEYERSDGGLAVVADGRIVLRDPGNARFTVYAPDGEYLEDWPARGGRPQLRASVNPLFSMSSSLTVGSSARSRRRLASPLPRPPSSAVRTFWATERDPLGVEYVVRYRVAIRGAEDDS